MPKPGEGTGRTAAVTRQAPGAPAAQAPPVDAPAPPAPSYAAPYPPAAGAVYYMTPAPGYVPVQPNLSPTPVYFAPAPLQAPVQQVAPPAAPESQAPASAPPLAFVTSPAFVAVPASAPPVAFVAVPPAPPVAQASVAEIAEQAPPVVAMPVAAEPPIEEDVLPEFAESGTGFEAEVVFAPQVLDEPVPGSGWGSAAVSPSSDAELEELLPFMPDSVLPYEGVVVGDDRVVTEDDSWSTSGWPEIVEAAVADSVASMPVDDWAADWPIASPPKVEPVAESPQPALESEEDLSSGPVEPPAAPGDDLKSRIEETRRRIREELDKPFAAMDDEPPAPEPVRAPAPVIGEAMRVTLAPSNGGAPAQAVAEAVASGDGADYDAMRARIESTRSRLKAKAFDAMMSGEAALLGRDGDDPAGSAKPATSFDTEIDQTVDTTLREEDS